MFSLVLRPEQPSTELALLTTALGVAVAEGVEGACGLDCRLKWPNDVTVSRRKLAGVLVETRLSGASVAVAVAGVGINLDWPEVPAELAERATSVGGELRRLGRAAGVDRAAVLDEVLYRFEQLYPAVTRSRREVLERATGRSEILGRDVTIRMADGSAFEGRATRLLMGGELEIISRAGPVSVDAGEIERVRAR